MSNEKSYSFNPNSENAREERVVVNLEAGNGTNDAEKYWQRKKVTDIDTPTPSTTAKGESQEEILEDYESAMDKANKAAGGSSSGSKSKKAAKQEADQKEIRTLQGDLVLRVNSKTIKLQVGETIKLNGLGKYLSGLYYITGISRTLDSSGYNQTISVMKTDFTKSLKEVQVETVKTNVIKR